MSFLYETHLHTTQASACAISTGAEQAAAYAKRGYAGIIVTDHFFEGNTCVPVHLPWAERIDQFAAGWQDAKEAGQALGLDVFFGWEFWAEGKEFLTYGLDCKFLYAHPELEQMTVADYSALIRANGGYLAQAHPYRNEAYMRNPGPVDPAYLDGVEGYNAHNRDEASNESAMAFARKHNLPVQAGTDSHSVKLKFPSGIILKHRAKNIFDIIAAIRNREVELITP
jgi:hypothetical protein